jgi:hypothetical protein
MSLSLTGLNRDEARARRRRRRQQTVEVAAAMYSEHKRGLAEESMPQNRG